MLLHKVMFSLSILLLALSSCSTDSSQKMEEQYRPLLSDSALDSLPGAILAVYDMNTGSKWIGVKGLADIKDKKTMTSQSRFHVGSVTKLYTAIAVLKLVDEDKLSLNTKVIDVLDTPAIFNIPYISQIEVKHLLNHSSGIYGFNNDMDYIQSKLGETSKTGEKWTKEELIALADSSRVEPFGVPETGAYYGDTNYVILDMIVEKIVDMSLREYISNQFIEPLKLSNTGYFDITPDPKEFEISATTKGYIKNSEIIESFISISDRFPRLPDNMINTTDAGEQIDGAAAIISNADDLITFSTALYSGKLLSDKSMSFLLAVSDSLKYQETGTDEQRILRAYNRDSGIVYTSQGDGPSGFHSILAYHPDNKLIVIAYTNVFGYFNEHDILLNMVDQVINQSTSEI
jgi:D-alanyl-D-alanine carboxypeptidase